MTLKEMQQFVVENIRYKDWEFHVKEKVPSACDWNDESVAPCGGTIYLQIQFLQLDSSGSCEGLRRQHCRKWQLSEHMTPTEIVRTAYKAVLAAEEHEASELFTYKGVAIYNPHRDVEALVEIGERSDCRR